MKRLLIGLLALGLTTQISAQVVNDGMLPEVEVHAVNYKYLNSVDHTEAAIPVKYLQEKVAKFDLKSSEFYEDGTNYYKLYFYIPEGNIVAAYDRKGKVLYTVERFKNVSLPEDVADAIEDRFPGWKVAKDVYKIDYSPDKEIKKRYKITLKNGDEVIRVKIDDEGVFL